SSKSTCTLSGNTSGSTASFIGVGTCTIDANQAGNAKYNAAPQEQQSFSVAKGSQTIVYTSSSPTNATVGGPPYPVTATGAGTRALLVVLPNSSSKSTCTLSGNTSGSTVSFIGVGTCTIDANQAENANYKAAAQVQQSFVVAAAPVP